MNNEYVLYIVSQDVSNIAQWVKNRKIVECFAQF